MPENLKKPYWIRGRVSWAEGSSETETVLEDLKLTTVCVEADCPNRGECWDNKHATFMILGDRCTRKCAFCSVLPGIPEPPDPSEPDRVAAAVKELGIEYAVITSVTRDDLEDKGAGQFVKTVKAINELCPDVLTEFLIPDLKGDKRLIKNIAFSGAEIVGHNIEIPGALYPGIRPGADYESSLGVLSYMSELRDRGEADIFVKSAMMLGLGEGYDDIIATFTDLKEAGTDIVYIGQYLSPSKSHSAVRRFYRPSEFEDFEKKAREMGFKSVLSGPMVRSSYRAYHSYLECARDRKSVV